MAILRKLSDLIETGRIKRFDFVAYTPDIRQYNTGIEDSYCYSGNINTYLETRWKVFNIYRSGDSALSIVADDNYGSISFLGIEGLNVAVEKLNEAAKVLYSSEKFGTIARSITIDDVNMIAGYVPKATKHYAYFLFDNLPRSSKIAFNGNEYIPLNTMDNTLFYMADGGGEEVVDEHGIRYRRPTKDNPVYMTSTAYEYSRLNRMRLGDWCMLASPYVECGEYSAIYGLRTANSTQVYRGLFGDSNTSKYKVNAKLRPIIDLKPNMLVDCTDTAVFDGSTPKKAWRLVADCDISKDDIIV